MHPCALLILVIYDGQIAENGPKMLLFGSPSSHHRILLMFHCVNRRLETHALLPTRSFRENVRTHSGMRRKHGIAHVTAATAKASEMGTGWAHLIGGVLPPAFDLFASNLVPDLRQIED